MTATPPPAQTPAEDAAAKFAADVETIASSLAQVAQKITEPTALTAVEGFFTALPGLVDLTLKFWAWADSVSGGNPGTLISNFGSRLAELQAAKTKEDVDAALQGLASVIGRLPS